MVYPAPTDSSVIIKTYHRQSLAALLWNNNPSDNVKKCQHLTQAKVLCHTAFINTNLLILEKVSIRRGTRPKKTANKPGASQTTPHPPPTLSTSLGRASPLEWSTTSSLGLCVEHLVVCHERLRGGGLYSGGGGVGATPHIHIHGSLIHRKEVE